MNSLLKSAQIELANEVDDYKQDVGKQAQRLMEIKTENMKTLRKKSIDVEDVTVDSIKEKRNSNDKDGKKGFSDNENSISETTRSSFGDWKIEYEEDI
jgi:hypothetical protein